MAGTRHEPIILPYARTPVSVQPWRAVFLEVAAQVIALIESQLPGITIEHIGSTAVPGCDGKGKVDFLIAFGPDELRPINEALETLGFQRQTGPDAFPETRPMRQGMIEHEGELFRLHVHIIPHESDEVGEMRRLRDRLRADDRLRDAYIALKHDLIAQGITYGPSFADAKGEFIRRAIGLHR